MDKSKIDCNIDIVKRPTTTTKRQIIITFALRFTFHIPFFLFFLPSLMMIFEAIIDVAIPATNEVNATHGMILFEVVLREVIWSLSKYSRSYYYIYIYIYIYCRKDF